MSEEESVFYKAIQDPRDFRRELLNSAKGIIHLLQRYQYIKELREKKVQLMHEFQAVLGELRFMNSRLKKTIPKTKLRNIPSETIQKPKKDHIDSLQDELADIESTLNKL